MTVIAIMLLMTKLTTLFVLIRYITSKSFQQYFFFPTCFPLKIDLLYRLSFELLQKEKKFHFRKISAVNNFRQLRISDGLIFGQKKIRNFVRPKFLGVNVSRFLMDGLLEQNGNFGKRSIKIFKFDMVE